MKILVTGGSGFIGGHFIKMFSDKHQIINYDSLTYAAKKTLIEGCEFVEGNICDGPKFSKLLDDFQPDWIVNFAAETHVDRSINEPFEFVKTNVVGTCILLEAIKNYWDNGKRDCRFLHISTDEVYGSLGESGKFTEQSQYAPNSPYSASKASADHFVRAYHKTYGLPVLTTNCSNNYGPYQFPEKLIPIMILNALNGKDLPIYGDGLQIRDWLFVEDHCRALELILEKGRIGEVYNIGGNCELTNLSIVRSIIDLVGIGTVIFVSDRPGHDKRYAVDCSKLTDELGWTPIETFYSGLKTTVEWYKRNQKWAACI